MTTINQLDFKLPTSDEFIERLLGAWHSRFTTNIDVLLNSKHMAQAVFAINSSLPQGRFDDSFRSFEISLYLRRENPCVNVYKCKCKNCKWFFSSYRSKLAALGGVFRLPSCKSYSFVSVDKNGNDRNILDEFKTELDALIIELEIIVRSSVLNSELFSIDELGFE